MSSRILSAYFNDFRKGKKQRSEIRDYLLAEVQKDPLRFGHLMSGLEQAQHDHPIPVTDFLLLRREVEAALNDDEQTMFVPHPEPASSAPIATSSDAETLLGVQQEKTPAPVDHEAETLAAPRGDEITIVPGETRRLVEQEETLGQSQRSDGVKEVELPTIITQHNVAAPSSQETSESQIKQSVIPLWGWAAGAVALAAIGLGIWSQQPLVPEINKPSVMVETAEQQTEFEDHSLLETSPIQQTEIEQPEIAEVPKQIEAAKELPIEEQPSPQWTAEQWLEKIKQRADRGYLLPENESHSAYTLLDQLQQRFPDSDQILQARRYLKNAYLRESKNASSNGDWDLSQQYLDAAFNILKPKQQLSSSDDSLAE